MAALLTIPQVFALLQIAPDGRARATVTRTQLGTAGGVLADLALRGAIALSKDRVVIASGTPTGDQVLDTALAWIASESPKPAKWWVRQLGKRTLHDGVVAQLVQRGVLTEEQHRTLLVFTTTRHPERDGLPRAQVRQAVDEVLAGRAASSPYIAAVIGLLDATDTLRSEFGRVDKRFLRSVVQGDWVAAAVRRVLADVNASAAMTAGVIASSSAATTAGSN
ncbi:GPP34 family phosphoprotein [uncultured Curtobacterium sp.]|uniref:GOLPH3/VPS74 family protein n=1 Tax=uncultured Curtobacterium sp. TaxID=331964 RepID=UPI002586C975|nr:GPP34 family phosphoprotein [uncultured Curtobacterium sp.]